MKQFFNVQMNLQDSPQVLSEQSKSFSSPSKQGAETETFKAVLQKALPEEQAVTNPLATTRQEASTAQTAPEQNDILHPLYNRGAKDSSKIFTILESNQQLLAQLPQLVKTINRDSLPGLGNQSPVQESDIELGDLATLLNTKTIASENSGAAPINIPSPQKDASFAEGMKNFADLQTALNNGSKGASSHIQTEPVVFPGEQRNPKTISPEQEALLRRLQTLLNNGAEAGTLSIKKVNSADNELFLRSQLSQLQQQEITGQARQVSVTRVGGEGASAFTPLEEGVFAPSLRTEQQELRGIRHDSNQQFYNAKVQPNVVGENSNQSGSQQGDTLGQQNSGFTQTAGGAASTTDAAVTFNLPNSSITNQQALQSTATTQTTLLPSGTLIHDQDVIQQLVDRFQFNRGQIESKIQMKLHPVELGKMEIDLSVKEGSIRANVVAQSQHVQEILERNLNKLRSVLEQQGFTIDEITVTSESEMVGEFDLFDQQLSNSNSSNSETRDDSAEDQPTFLLDELQPNFLDADTSVNVKV